MTSSSSSSSASRSTTKASAAATTASNLSSTKPTSAAAASSLASTSSSSAAKPSTSASSGGSKDKKDKKEKKRKYVRMAAGNVWEDVSLNEWDPDDFRLFCGDLGNEVTDDVLNRVFSKYPSFQKARVIRDKRTNKTKGFGFASFKDPTDFMKAIRDLNGKYVGNRPIKLKKSCWQDRQYENMKKREREKKRLGFR
ncbi:hypothetical protein HELRODRAFT_76581 [Helobdella robusta]|uniref:RNA-binding protein 42 n=1 Tax=Helobdella robusta TaxID=6412 RepID=T1G2L6_HELRO|nr:hypothetical protein HELRODRAFT_76581 [Helobdella robusta]ESO07169.1 hypothetical protein HELRODRAFT_76581 [Helobdella robusta]